MDFDRILKPNEVIKRLKCAEKQCVKGYYYILIRPNMRDRIVELLENQQKQINKFESDKGWDESPDMMGRW